MFGLNIPRQVVSAVNRKGLANLSPEEKAYLPARIDTTDEQHRKLFRAYFGGDDTLHGGGMPAEQWQRLFEAQCTWDAAMGWNAVKALETYGDKDAIMVVLIGTGHAAYGLGAERQARLGFAARPLR
jgi:uncharacterized iron-regulated protein